MGAWRIVLGGAVVAAGLASCGGGGAAPALPLTGTTAGQRYRLEAVRNRSHDVHRRWCLRLRHTGDLVVNDGPYIGGLQACGPAPAPRVSGAYVADCQHGTLYVFGVARAQTEHLELAAERGRALRPRTAALPAHAGFAGTTFLFAVDLRVLPATLREKGDAIVRLPARSSLCRSHRGAPKGGEPGGAF